MKYEISRQIRERSTITTSIDSRSIEREVLGIMNILSIVSSEGSLSERLDTRRAELLSDGYIRENSARELEIPTDRGNGDFREDAPTDRSNAPWYSPSLNDSNVDNVFRRFLNAEKPKYQNMKQNALFETTYSAETVRIGADRGPKPEMAILSRGSSVLPSTVNWRLDPAKSYSDWEIKIVSTSGEEDSYHVHRMVLAAGARSSKYFTNLFKSKGSDLKSQRLRLEMPDESAEMFPVFLDFAYGEDDIASVENKDQAFAVYELAEYFDTPMLKIAVKNWCSKRLSWYQVPDFLSHLDRIEDSGPLVDMAIQKCAKNFEELGTDFGALIGPKYLSMILDALQVRRFVFALGIDYISEMILACCEAHPEMDEEAFTTMTNTTFLPHIPVEGIIRLLKEDAKFCEPSEEELSSLQSRCVESLIDNWEYFAYRNKENMQETVLSLPKIVLAQVLIQITPTAST